ncbi:MAG: glycoside hydrolase family 9 protein [Eubacterium sp.]|nr:glycoside hydrolase family 9 protein [Eubacterium sp.]
MYCRGIKSKVISLIVSLIMVISLVSVMPAMKVKAADPVNEIDITEFNGFPKEITGTSGAEGPSWAIGAYEIKIQLPEEYNSFNELHSAGVTNLEVYITIKNYSDANRDAGFQLFSYSTDRNGAAIWDNHNGDGWFYLRNMGSTSYKTTYNFSRQSSNNLLYLGVQFALLDPGTDVTFTIDSVKLVKDRDEWPAYNVTPISDTAVDCKFDPKPNYAKLLQESLYFFDMNMCGDDVDEKTGVLWRGNCHTDDITTYDGDEVNVTGGYHDSGDHVKLGLPQAYAASTLGIIYKEYKSDFEELGQDEHIKLHLNRFADYFKNCTVLDNEGNVKAFCYQVGNGVADHEYWGAPEKQGARKNYIKFTSSDNPCTDIVAETAAALAIHSVIFDNSKSLDYAIALLEYAENNAMRCASPTGFYDGDSYNDDLALASYWIYTATKDVDYRTKYTSYLNKTVEDGDGNEISYLYNVWDGNECWNDVYAATMLSLDYNLLDDLMDKRSKEITPYGYAYIADGCATAAYNTTLQFIALALDKHRGKDIYKAWATGQMNYILGNNPAEKCYVIGYNDRSVLYPHHRAASGYIGDPKDDTLPEHLMLGTLVGGPIGDSIDGDLYVDKTSNWESNEPSLNYQVGLVGAAVALYHAYKGDTNVEKTLHSELYLKSVEIDKYYGNGNDDPYHPHKLTHTEAKEPTCTKDGNVEYWYCELCEKYFTDADCTEEAEEDELVIEATDHEWNDPTYTWTEGVDSFTCKAEKTCKNNTEDSCKVSETVTVAKDSIDVTEAADCEKDGKGICTVKFKNTDFETQTKEVVISATGHDFSPVEYTWADDNSTVTATRVCKNNPEHNESETVNAKYEVIKEAAGTEDGVGKYTSDQFENENFEVQTKEVVIPAPEKPSGQEDPGKKEDPEQQGKEQKAEDGTDVGPGASETVAEKAIINSDSDEGPAGSSFGLLQAKMKKATKNSITITWNKVSGAKYVIYGNKCGKTTKFEKITEVTSNKYTQKKLKKGTYYKYIVVAVKDGKVVSTSKTLHIATKGGKVCNHSKVKLNKKSLKLKKGKKAKLKAKLVKESKKLKVQNHRKVKFESSDTAVVTVTDKGKVKAVGRGTAYIYAYAQNGKMAKVKVVVK